MIKWFLRLFPYVARLEMALEAGAVEGKRDAAIVKDFQLKAARLENKLKEAEEKITRIDQLYMDQAARVAEAQIVCGDRWQYKDADARLTKIREVLTRKAVAKLGQTGWPREVPDTTATLRDATRP